MPNGRLAFDHRIERHAGGSAATQEVESADLSTTGGCFAVGDVGDGQHTKIDAQPSVTSRAWARAAAPIVTVTVRRGGRGERCLEAWEASTGRRRDRGRLDDVRVLPRQRSAT